MKVTRLKNGFNIRLSDSEMTMLNTLVVEGLVSNEGLDGVEHFYDSLDSAAKTAYTRRVKKVGGEYRILSTDEDRR